MIKSKVGMRVNISMVIRLKNLEKYLGNNRIPLLHRLSHLINRSNEVLLNLNYKETQL